MTSVAAPTKYETIIGLEVHAQLLTRSKMFCGCSASYADSPPNTHVCPVCLGMPGVLPRINRQAVQYTIMTALALHCEIPERAKFDRKNYPYPDLMKGYQISEYDMPLSRNGWLNIEVEGTSKRIGITRVHLEEDTARLLHRQNGAGEVYSLVDVNRSGVPLMEIVSEPDVRSGAEARAYLQKLRQVLRYLGVSDADMERGSMRCEPNISLRRVGDTTLPSYKVEIKNLNSFRAVERAVDYEINRQMEILERGEQPAQETRGWDETRGVTFSQRSKEYAHDYRYFPEPDLPVLVLTREWVEAIRAQLPELPDEKRERFLREYGLSEYEVNLLIETRARADYFEAAVASVPADADQRKQRYTKAVANWMLGDFARLLNATGSEIQDALVRPQQLAEMIGLIEDGTISSKIAKTVFEEMYRTGKDPRTIVAEQGLTQVSEAGAIEEVVNNVIAANAKAVADYRSGKQDALKFLVGQVMKETRGRANPGLVNDLLRQKLASE